MGTDMLLFYGIYVLNFQIMQLYLIFKLYKSYELFLKLKFYSFLTYLDSNSNEESREVLSPVPSPTVTLLLWGNTHFSQFHLHSSGDFFFACQSNYAYILPIAISLKWLFDRHK